MALIDKTLVETLEEKANSRTEIRLAIRHQLENPPSGPGEAGHYFEALAGALHEYFGAEEELDRRLLERARS